MSLLTKTYFGILFDFLKFVYDPHSLLSLGRADSYRPRSKDTGSNLGKMYREHPKYIHLKFKETTRSIDFKAYTMCNLINAQPYTP